MLNWGILGAGGIARVFCNGLRLSKTGQAAAVASQTPAKLNALADDFGIAKRYSTYEAMLQDPEIEAIYVSTIHPMHAQWAIKAAEAGKHLLVEKPIGMNYAEAAAIVDAATKHDVFLMEAYMYRCHPQTQKLAALVREGAIGEVRLIRSVFSYYTSYSPSSRAFNIELGASGILDVGCYPASMSRLIAGAAAGRAFLDPVKVKACGKVSPTGVDLYTAAILQFENDIVAELFTGVTCTVPVETAVFGEKGTISVPNPWLPSSPARSAKQPLPLDTQFGTSIIELTLYGQAPQQIVVEPDRDLFTYEADTVAAHIADRQAPAMRWDDTLGNMRVLDLWRQEIGAKV